MRGRDDRHLRLAESVAGVPRERIAQKFLQANIDLGWRAELEDHQAGRALVSTSANLISRFCPRIRLLADSDFAREVQKMLRQIDDGPDADFPVGQPSVDADISIWLGGGTPSESFTTFASADGWIAYVSSGEGDLPVMPDGKNALGALAAAGLVAAEAFKRLLPPLPHRGGLFDATPFSTWSYTTSPDQGPELPNSLQIPGEILLAGVGAVGQGFIHALIHAPILEGAIRVVDNDRVDDSNLNRYVMATVTDAGTRIPKTLLATQAFVGRPTVIHAESRDLKTVLDEVSSSELAKPSIVVSALDNDGARYELQNLWPDYLFEGATGDTLLQVFRHAHNEGTACLRCIHPPPSEGTRFEETMAQATGLPQDRISRALHGQDRFVTEADIDQADEHARSVLREKLGHDLCGVLAELERFATADAPVQPAVSFTSYLAGCLTAIEVIRHLAGLPPGVPSRFQLDPIATLDPGPPWAESKREDCYCRERAATIEAYRELVRHAESPAS
jgi:molybdopterin/thiamine biosynthesis adenylyltransferase